MNQPPKISYAQKNNPEICLAIDSMFVSIPKDELIARLKEAICVLNGWAGIYSDPRCLYCVEIIKGNILIDS